MKNYVPVHYEIIKETEKAVYCEVQSNWDRKDSCRWIPKSLCEIRVYEDTFDKNGDPITNAGKLVVGVAEWFAYKNRLVR